MENLEMAIKYSADASLDLLTIDGSGGGTGMSPWNMMQYWGIPSLALHAKSHEYCKILADRGQKLPAISLALGSPYARIVCLGRAAHDCRIHGQQY
jgi:hypothetical protein